MLFLLGGFTFNFGIANVTSSYLSLCAGEEWSLNSSQVANIVIMVTVGSIFGALTYGQFADRFGRRPSAVVSAGFLSIFSILTAFAPNYGSLLAFRFLFGVGLGGVNITFDSLAEVSAVGYRSFILTVFLTLNSLSTTFALMNAWIFLTNYGWRVMSLVAAIPVTISFILMCIFYPESPRWLLLKGRKTESVDAITNIFHRNSTIMPPCTLKDSDVPVAQSIILVDKLVETRAGLMITIRLCIAFLINGCNQQWIAFYLLRLTGPESQDDDSDDIDQCTFDYPALTIGIAGIWIGMVFTLGVVWKYGVLKWAYVFGAVCMGIVSLLMGFNFPLAASTLLTTIFSALTLYVGVSSRMNVYVYVLSICVVKLWGGTRRHLYYRDVYPSIHPSIRTSIN
jgi:MFS family permease